MAGDETDKKDSEAIPDKSSEHEIQIAEEKVKESESEPDVPVDETEASIKEAVETALADQKDTVLRARAEVQNMSRRCEADVERAHKFALEKFSTKLFSVMDNLERALEAVPDTEHEKVKTLYEGVELTLKGLMEVFSEFNIEQIDPLGEPFDPQLHEAMSTQDNDEVEPNTVTAVMQKGYTLNGRVIRPATVMVSKK